MTEQESKPGFPGPGQPVVNGASDKGDALSNASGCRAYVMEDVESLKADALAKLIVKQVEKWPQGDVQPGAPNSDKWPKWNIKKLPAKKYMIKALTDVQYGFSTTGPLPGRRPEVNKSKTAAGRTLSYQKDTAVKVAYANGTVKNVPLAQELEKSGVQRAIAPLNNPAPITGKVGAALETTLRTSENTKQGEIGSNSHNQQTSPADVYTNEDEVRDDSDDTIREDRNDDDERNVNGCDGDAKGYNNINSLTRRNDGTDIINIGRGESVKGGSPNATATIAGDIFQAQGGGGNSYSDVIDEGLPDEQVYQKSSNEGNAVSNQAGVPTGDTILLPKEGTPGLPYKEQPKPATAVFNGDTSQALASTLFDRHLPVDQQSKDLRWSDDSSASRLKLDYLGSVGIDTHFPPQKPTTNDTSPGTYNLAGISMPQLGSNLPLEHFQWSESTLAKIAPPTDGPSFDASRDDAFNEAHMRTAQDADVLMNTLNTHTSSGEGDPAFEECHMPYMHREDLYNYRDVTVIISDHRGPQPSEEEALVSLECRPAAIWPAGYWDTTARNLVAAVQLTPARIYRDAKICVPSSVRPGVFRPIATLQDGLDLECENTTVRISKDNDVALVVRLLDPGTVTVQPSYTVKEDNNTPLPSGPGMMGMKRSQSPVSASEASNGGTSVGDTHVKKARFTVKAKNENSTDKEGKKEADKKEIIDYLTGKLSLREGWDDFRSAKGKTFGPAVTLRHYKFAAAFIDEFNNTRTSRTVVDTNPNPTSRYFRIAKVQIIAALNRNASWEHGMRETLELAGKLGRGGQYCDRRAVDLLAGDEGGSVFLLKELKNIWKDIRKA